MEGGREGGMEGWREGVGLSLIHMVKLCCVCVGG